MSMLPISAKIKAAADALRDPKAPATINKTIAGIIEGEIWRRATPEVQPGLRAVMRALWNPFDTGAGQIIPTEEAAAKLDKLAEQQADQEPVQMTRAQYNAAIAAARAEGAKFHALGSEVIAAREVSENAAHN